MTKLSVVIPCFNCAATLAEAVDSLYRQKPTFEVDVTMIDDGSTDSTYGVMQDLAQRHPNIRLLQHKTNLGGGAARNAAIRQSDGDLVFCLDSDDMLGPGFLENMTRYWSSHRCDGLGMSTSIKFRGRRIEDVSYISRFEGPGRTVRFESFLERDRCSLGVVFMLRRSAFERIGGYPTEHGFDTQGIAFRFLCNGLTAITCPETVYYHRVGMSKSYYRREHSAGRVNWNWFNVFDEFLYVFSRAVQTLILEHALFDVPGEPAPPELLRQVTSAPKIYAPNYKRLIRRGPDGVARDIKGSKDGLKQYWIGNFHRLRARNAAALAHYSKALANGLAVRMIYYRMLQAELAHSRNTAGAERTIEDMLLHSRPYPMHERPLLQRVFLAMRAHDQLRASATTVKAWKDALTGRRAH